MSEGQERPRIQQARKPEEIEKENQDNFRLSSLRKHIAAGVLILGTVGAAGAVTAKLEQDNKIDENYSSLQGQEIRLNGSKLKFDGDKVRIRQASNVPTNKGVDNQINSESIKSINGEAWDGKSDFTIENIPYISGEDPTHRLDDAPWLILEIETDDGSKDLGYISKSGATSEIIETITKGEVADIKFDKNNNLEATFDSGKTVTEGEIGKVEIVRDQITSS